MLNGAISDPHIRPVQLRKDLPQIADLIEICFAPYLDAEGRDYVRHIRQAPRDYDRFILDNSTPESSNLPFHGYVWVEAKKIIGNLTLILIRRKLKQAYFIANVAVHPDYRGQGIARKLTDRAIEHVQQHKGRNIYLQVRSENEIAQRLYTTHGFEEMARRTQWVFRPGHDYRIPNDPEVRVGRRQRVDWDHQHNWLEALFPPEIAWNFPLFIEKMKPSFMNSIDLFLNGTFQRTWGAYLENTFIGAATLSQHGEPNDYIWLASSPIWEEKVIRSLLPVIQRQVLSPHKLVVNYPTSRGTDAFKSAGMVESNTLFWMKRSMEYIQ